jgi:hypothetical protein
MCAFQAFKAMAGSGRREPFQSAAEKVGVMPILCAIVVYRSVVNALSVVGPAHIMFQT